MTPLEEHYNKFNEDKRLERRHGHIEYVTSMKYIHQYLEQMENPKIMDIGAGTGAYSVPLANEGYDVTAVELVKKNLGLLKQKHSNVKAYQGNALNLKKFKDDTFDLTLLFGPMYHLYTFEDKVKALSEAKRITKKGGIILVAYLMNEYSIITYGFKQNHIKELVADKRVTEDFHCLCTPYDLYDYMRLEDIEKLNCEVGIERLKIVTPDGPANFMRREINAMDEETYKLFIEYHLSVCERPDLLGAAGHTLDILKNK